MEELLERTFHAVMLPEDLSMAFAHAQSMIAGDLQTYLNASAQRKSSPPFGTPRLSLSTDVFQPLHKPIEFPLSFTEIYCCPPVLLSVLLSKVTGKCRVGACSGDLHTKKKEPQPTKIAALSIFVHDSSSIAVSLIWVRMIAEDDCRDNEGVEEEM